MKRKLTYLEVFGPIRRSCRKSCQYYISKASVVLLRYRKHRLRNHIFSISVSLVVLYSYLCSILTRFLGEEEGISLLDANTFEHRYNNFADLIGITFFPAHQLSRWEIDIDQEIENGDDEWGIVKRFSFEYDPRLMPSLWISSIQENLERDGGFFDTKFALPFSWSSWLDLSLNPRENPSSISLNEINCENFENTFKIENANFLSKCKSLRSAPSHYTRLKIVDVVDYPLSEFGRKVIGRSYLLHSAPIPQRVFFLGLGGNGKGIIVPTFSLERRNAYDKSDLSVLVDDYVKTHVDSSNNTGKLFKDGISFTQEVSNLNKYLNHFRSGLTSIDDQSLKYDIFRFVNGLSVLDPTRVELSKSDFAFDLVDFHKKLKHTLSDSYRNSILNDFDRRLLNSIEKESERLPNFPKYFHEASILGTNRGSHYDWRFFNGINYSEYERKAILHRLTRAWLQFANSLGLVTWIAHGSLLGWYWNGMNLPWDQDLDVQMTMESLIRLSRNYNQTLVVDSLVWDDETGTSSGSTYFVDVNRYYYSRTRGNGNNAIDARFIDINTGLYVDITALAFTNSGTEISISKKQSLEFNQFLDADYLEKERSQTISKEALDQELFSRRAAHYNSGNMFNCKNNHFYKIEDLSPLESTNFEGAKAFVPASYKAILRREYPHGLHSRQYDGHMYRPFLRLWVPKSVCSKDTIGNKCNDQETLLETKFTSDITKLHKSEVTSSSLAKFHIHNELEPIRVDPWIIRRGMAMTETNKNHIS